MAKKPNVKLIVAELDEISNTLQSKGHLRLAKKVDLISNTLESSAIKVASDPDKAPEGSLPGSQSSVQVADQFDAVRGKDYGPTPIGNDSVSAVVGAESVADILSKLDFAQRGSAEEKQDIHIQASKKYEWPFEDITPADVSKWAAAGEWSNVVRAARLAAGALDPSDPGLDLGDDSEDGLYSTGDLPASGHEDLVTDDVGPDQQGKLQLFDKTPAGTGEGSGHHGPTAAKILEAAARLAEDAKVDVFNPDDHFGEDKDPVEESHSLGGKGKEAAKTATVNVQRPDSVPAHMSGVWTEVVNYTNGRGKLLVAGKVNYPELLKNYQSVLKHYLRKASSNDTQDCADDHDSETEN